MCVYLLRAKFFTYSCEIFSVDLNETFFFYSFITLFYKVVIITNLSAPKFLNK